MKRHRTSSRIEEEKRIVALMIQIYCRKKEKNKELCTTCRSLLAYAHERLERCKFGEEKTACQHCPIHCYKPDMRKRMREVMRFSGPRMLFYHPLAAFRHLLKK